MSEYVITHFQSKKQEIPDAYEFVTNDGEEIEYRQIVRCRDCKHYDKSDAGCSYFVLAENKLLHIGNPDGFCAWGVREDGDAR